MVTLFEKTGLEVRAAANGREAVDLCAQWRPHFIWMDIRMPVMDGREATRRIRATEAGGSIKIAALTASCMEKDRESIMQAGFDDYVRKPFREEEIFAVMAKHLGLTYLRAGERADEPAREAGSGLSAQRVQAALPPELFGELHHAVLTLDTDQTITVVEKIALIEPAIGAALKKIALDLEYDRILELLGEIGAAPPPQPGSAENMPGAHAPRDRHDN